jgi:hypothetical protein
MGYPNLLLSALRATGDGAAEGHLTGSLREYLEQLPPGKDPKSGVMLWIGAGVDAADGELRLDRSWRLFSPDAAALAEHIAAHAA